MNFPSWLMTGLMVVAAVLFITAACTGGRSR